MIAVTLYTRPGCGLCQDVKDELDALAREFPHQLTEINIGEDPSLWAHYKNIIPVVAIGTLRLMYPFSTLDLRAALHAQKATPHVL